VFKLPRLTGLLRRERIDLLHTHLFHADLAGRIAADAAGVPHLVHTVWTAEGRFRPWQFAHARFFASRCDRIVCVSQSVREHHARRSGLPGRCYTVIPWGSDADEFRPDPAARRRLRAEWRLRDDDVLVAFVGRLEFYKGIETLLAAMSHLGARGDATHLVVAGDGPMRPVVENFVAHGEGGGHARMLGHVRDVRAVLSAADIFAIPSFWEGWPLALGEAMSAGLPAIGTDVPGIRDVLVDGQTGLMIEKGDAIALAESIRRLAGDAGLRRRLGEAGRRRIAERFGLDATVAAHARLYDEIAGRRRER